MSDITIEIVESLHFERKETFINRVLETSPLSYERNFETTKGHWSNGVRVLFSVNGKFLYMAVDNNRFYGATNLSDLYTLWKMLTGKELTNDES